jgi:CheY-like chemotaxis protein
MPITTHTIAGHRNAAGNCIWLAPARRALVIDNDPMICLLLGEMLQQMGHGVCGSASGEASALAMAAKLHPDLLIVDAWLGAESGLDTVTKILRTRFIPHIFTSGNIDKLRQLRPEAEALEKPFKEPALALAIQNALYDATTASG